MPIKRVVFDLDGTLSDAKHRRHLVNKDPKDWQAWQDASVRDKPVKQVVDLYRMLKDQGAEIHVWTGRTDAQRKATEAWMALHKIPKPKTLKMRPEGDRSSSEEVKQKWLSDMRKSDPKWGPDLVIDDQDKDVAFWRKKGIRTLQVREPEAQPKPKPKAPQPKPLDEEVKA